MPAATRSASRPEQGVSAERARLARTCDRGLTRAFAFLGKRWNAVLLATLEDGPAGFAELARSVNGISDSMLSSRLGELAAAGLVERTVCPGPPVTVAYALTDRGRALLPALAELGRWASEHLPETAAEPTAG